MIKALMKHLQVLAGLSLGFCQLVLLFYTHNAAVDDFDGLFGDGRSAVGRCLSNSSYYILFIKELSVNQKNA